MAVVDVGVVRCACESSSSRCGCVCGSPGGSPGPCVLVVCVVPVRVVVLHRMVRGLTAWWSRGQA